MHDCHEHDPLRHERGDGTRLYTRAQTKQLIARAIAWSTVDIYRWLTAIEKSINLLGENLVNVQEYAAAVDAETNRIADALEELKGQLAADEAADQASLDASFEPVLERLRGVGKEGPTAPPAEEPPAEEPPAEPAPEPAPDQPAQPQG